MTVDEARSALESALAERRRRIAALYGDGLSLRQVARIVGISDQMVWLNLRREGVRLRSACRPRKQQAPVTHSGGRPVCCGRVMLPVGEPVSQWHCLRCARDIVQEASGSRQRGRG